MTGSRRVHIVVTGLVQGVFFRASTAEVATSLELVGSVRNLPSGAVEIDAQGESEGVERLVEWARHGPPSARVESVQVSELETDDALSNFSIRR